MHLKCQIRQLTFKWDQRSFIYRAQIGYPDNSRYTDQIIAKDIKLPANQFPVTEQLLCSQHTQSLFYQIHNTIRELRSGFDSVSRVSAASYDGQTHTDWMDSVRLVKPKSQLSTLKCGSKVPLVSGLRYISQTSVALTRIMLRRLYFCMLSIVCPAKRTFQLSQRCDLSAIC